MIANWYKVYDRVMYVFLFCFVFFDLFCFVLFFALFLEFVYPIGTVWTDLINDHKIFIVPDIYEVKRDLKGGLHDAFWQFYFVL